MIDYTGIQCPVCHQPFRENDDIVVCPECGAPHHRECFAKTGHCALEDKHGTPEDWSHQQQQARQASLTKECPRCHAMNEEETLFCKECGQSLNYYSKTADDPAGDPAGTPPFRQGPFPGGPFPPGPNGMPINPIGPITPEDDFGGVKAMDIAKAVQVNPRYYLLVFARILRLGRSRFNFAAFFFSGAWYLFRKQYLLGSIFLIAHVALAAGAALMNMFYVLPLVHSLDPGLASNFSLYRINEVIPKVMQLGGLQTFLCILPLIFSAMLLALRIVIGAKANRLYLKRCIRLVKDCHADHTGFASVDEKLQKKGGVNAPLIMILVFAYFALYFLMLYLP